MKNNISKHVNLTLKTNPHEESPSNYTIPLHFTIKNNLKLKNKSSHGDDHLKTNPI
jgi:hypothetical protein